MADFWQQFKKPIFALAPLSGITDSAFRQVCRRLGADVVYSELSSATALFFQPDKTLQMLRFEEIERPYVVQLFGSDPEHFAGATRIVTQVLQPDGIDINFGCPISKVFKKGAGAALMTNLPLAEEVIRSVIENTHLPVSIKVRTRVKGVELSSLLDRVSGLDLKALMIHGRSYSQKFSGPNDIETTRNAREQFNGIILANGGVNNWVQGMDLLQQTGADGLGVARGAFGNPWIFQELKGALECNGKVAYQAQEVFETALEHAALLADYKGRRGIIEMRKHLCWYLKHVPGGKKLRQRAVQINAVQDIEELISEFMATEALTGNP
jgi:nifR3 family TIM-barrel protein